MVITSQFGNRYHPIQKKYKPHYGIDISVPVNTPVFAVADGQVTVASWVNGYGNYIKIKHSNGVDSIYAHLNSIGVHSGDKVKQGQIIGKSGNTGKSTGPHLHFEIHLDNKPVDPIKYLYQ